MKLPESLSLLSAALFLAPVTSTGGGTNFEEVILGMELKTAAAIGLGDRPIAELPEEVRLPDSELALVADYQHAVGGRIPVRLINRTGKPIYLGAQDRDVYLKLEVQDADGTWKRAQTHRLSGCGNSYDLRMPVRNDHFLALAGYQPQAGERATIRFRLYRQTFEAVSNVGEGIVDRAEVDAAQQDQLVVLGEGFDFLAAVAQGTLQSAAWSQRENRQRAIMELGERGFVRAKAREALEAVVAAGEEPFTTSAQEELSRLARRRER